MAGEGLFFTGVVLKNNRDLIQEQATRDQLKLAKESGCLELAVGIETVDNGVMKIINNSNLDIS